MNPISRSEEKPAARLLGAVLSGGWKVTESVVRTAAQTGAFFSEGYVVEKPTGERAFLKAMDFSAALREIDFVRAVESLARQFNFERDMLDLCRSKKMSNIVRAVDDGFMDLGDERGPLSRVQYFIFEPADGDIRKVISVIGEITEEWALRALHEASIGLRQLHLAMLAHQDLKPSNVLVFGGGQSIKLGDLGCASSKQIPSPRDANRIPGQLDYAPLEQLYGFLHPDWVVRRVGSDLYQLGGLASFLYAGVTINSLVSTRLDQKHHWQNWAGSYEEVMPFLERAFAEALDELAEKLKGKFAQDIIQIIRELSEPRMEVRGHPRRVGKGISFQYSVEPYVSRLGNLRASAAVSARRAIR